MGAPPDFRIIRKAADGKKWENVGAAWKRDNDEGFSISLEPNGRGGEKVKYLMVKNETKKAPTESEQPIPQLIDDQLPPF